MKQSESTDFYPKKEKNDWIHLGEKKNINEKGDFISTRIPTSFI